MYGDEIFSAEPPIPVRKKKKSPPPNVDVKPKRRYVRRSVENPIPSTDLSENRSEALLAAEGLFEDEQLHGYYIVDAFIRLYEMVKPESRKDLAKILEGLVSNPRPMTK